MAKQTVRLSVPAEADFARTVRMMAANLAVVSNMSVDDVEDVRMAAEEGFVYCCATKPDACEVSFDLLDGEMHTTFTLGMSDIDDEDGTLGLAELLLSAVCDEHAVSDDGLYLHLVKRTGVAHGE
ncbi:MAG: ATP-binding protein [Atopobiaceae bacterium]|nr:ATP-binding protein [Atopobiaceae bacterium]